MPTLNDIYDLYFHMKKSKLKEMKKLSEAEEPVEGTARPGTLPPKEI